MKQSGLQENDLMSWDVGRVTIDHFSYWALQTFKKHKASTIIFAAQF
jgi:hypothetical protein